MKNILWISILGLMLSGCISPGDNTYGDFQKYWETERKWKTAKACPKSKLEKGGSCVWSAKSTQEEANEDALNYCNKSDCVITMEGNKTVYTYEDLKSSELASIINNSKNTCKTLGFEEGTEKFTECALKLYTQEVDNKVAIEVAKRKSSSSSSSGTMTIYDPVRDRQNQIDKGMKMLSGGCTLGIDC